MQITLFLHLTALPAWLALSRPDRRRIGEAALAHAAFPRLRHFDAEAFSALSSDIVMVEGDSIDGLYAAMERLRDTPMFTTPYFRLDAIYPTVEDGFRQFEAAEGLA